MKKMTDLEKLLEEYHKIGVEKAINYEEYNNILITAHSTKIEGSTLSFEEAVELIQKGNTPGGKPLEFSLFTIDHYQALNFVIKEADKKRTISVDFIKEIAAKVMKNTGEVYQNALGKTDATKGDFRLTSVRAGSTVFMSYQKIKPTIDSLVKELNLQIKNMKTIEDKLLLAFYAHYKLVDIHPFIDGNGRTSRLLMNFIQRLYSLPMGIVFSEDKHRYYQAINSVKETESFDAYNSFMFEQYIKHISIEIEKEKTAQGHSNAPEIKPKWRL